MRRHDDYVRVLGKAWAPITEEQNFSVTPQQARTYIRAYYKRHKKRKLQLPIAEDRHVKHGPWRHGSVIKYDPRSGWRDLNHVFSHWVHRSLHPYDDPHCDRHLEMERDGAELIKRRFLK